MAQQTSDRQLDAMLNAFLDRLLVAATPKTDEQVVEALSGHEPTVMFAKSSPCWTGEEI
jgi:hypothetical protein